MVERTTPSKLVRWIEATTGDNKGSVTNLDSYKNMVLSALQGGATEGDLIAEEHSWCPRTLTFGVIRR